MFVVHGCCALKTPALSAKRRHITKQGGGHLHAHFLSMNWLLNANVPWWELFGKGALETVASELELPREQVQTQLKAGAIVADWIWRMCIFPTFGSQRVDHRLAK